MLLALQGFSNHKKIPVTGNIVPLCVFVGVAVVVCGGSQVSGWFL